MFTIKQFLLGREKEVWSVSPSTTLYKALQLMAEKAIGAVPVMESEKIIGIFSERDFARNSVSMERVCLDQPVNKYMTKKVRQVTPRNSMEECMAIMTMHHVRHLPILENNRLVGIITIGDVVKHVIKEQKFVLRKVLDSVEEGKNTLRTDITFNIEQNILPLVKQLTKRYPRDAASFRLLEEHLDQIASEYYRKLASSEFNFTPTEISVIKLIKTNCREKEISEALGISVSTVKKHKYSIRGKLGIRNKSGNISTHLDRIG